MNPRPIEDMTDEEVDKEIMSYMISDNTYVPHAGKFNFGKKKIQNYEDIYKMYNDMTIPAQVKRHKKTAKRKAKASRRKNRRKK